VIVVSDTTPLNIDDRDGSWEATRNGLNVIGTLGILEEAAKRGLIDIEQKTKALKQTNPDGSPVELALRLDYHQVSDQ
jgi:predicted nucleic acid-binding protein